MSRARGLRYKRVIVERRARADMQRKMRARRFFVAAACRYNISRYYRKRTRAPFSHALSDPRPKEDRCRVRSIFDLAFENDHGERRDIDRSIARSIFGRWICVAPRSLGMLKKTRERKNGRCIIQRLIYDVPELRDVNVTSTLSRYCRARPVSFLLHVNKIYI